MSVLFVNRCRKSSKKMSFLPVKSYRFVLGEGRQLSFFVPNSPYFTPKIEVPKFPNLTKKCRFGKKDPRFIGFWRINGVNADYFANRFLPI